MARVNISLQKRLTATLTNRMYEQLDTLSSTSACAGIKGNANAADKMRMNHHGSFSNKVPARPFINYATRKLNDMDFSAELRAVIKEQFSEPVYQKYKGEMVNKIYEDPITGETEAYTEYVRTHTQKSSLFGASTKQEQRGPVRMMRRIAEQMAENQRHSIAERSFGEGPTNGNDPAHNVPRWAKNKGFDWPLVETGESLKAIRGWTE